MPEPRVPKFRVPAALVSPASLFLVGGIIYYFTLDKPSEDELNNNIGREFPDVSLWSRVDGGAPGMRAGLIRVRVKREDFDGCACSQVRQSSAAHDHAYAG